MKLSPKANEIYSQISGEDTKLGELRKIAKEIKRDHVLALELWSTGNYFAQQLAILIMDKRLLTQEVIDQFDQDIQEHDYTKRNQLTDWLMANQLTKHKNTLALIGAWEDSPSAMQRRIYWYFQGRLRWTGKTPPDNTDDLLTAMEARLADEVPEVQWAMNFTAAQIGIFEPDFRARCIKLGEDIGLYKGLPVSKGCTPDYLPDWISIEVTKLEQRKNSH